MGGKGGNLLVEGEMMWRKDLEWLGRGAAGGAIQLFGSAGGGDIPRPILKREGDVFAEGGQSRRSPHLCPRFPGNCCAKPCAHP